MWWAGAADVAGLGSGWKRSEERRVGKECRGRCAMLREGQGRASAQVALAACASSLQAENGIRDGHVTGVQTCALPIWVHFRDASFLSSNPRPTHLTVRRRGGQRKSWYAPSECGGPGQQTLLDWVAVGRDRKSVV